MRSTSRYCSINGARIFNFMNTNLRLPILLLAFLLACVPARAASVSVVSAGETAPGAPTTLTVYLQTDTAAVNAIEGALEVPKGVTVESASVAGSAFTLWPAPPQYVIADHKIEFSGGVPGGVAPGTRVKLFSIVANAETAGTYVFHPLSMTAYRNDGKGTPEPITVTDATLAVRAGAAAPSAPGSGTGQPLVAIVGSDASLFNGNSFVAFYGGDRGQGVLRYEVEEGFFAPYESANRFYVLRDQNAGTPVWVRAVDASGIIRTEHVPGTGDAWYYGVVSAPFVIIALALFAFFYRRNRRRSLR